MARVREAGAWGSVALVALLVAIGPGEPVSALGAGCPDRASWLRQTQAEVLDLLHEGDPVLDLTTLRNEADLSRLAAEGYDFYPHHRASVRDIGWAVLDGLVPHDPVGLRPIPGRPSALVFEPWGADVTDAHASWDFPYRLVGWAYFFGYDFGVAPTTVVVDGEDVGDFSCIRREEWFVHERGTHHWTDGGMTTHPPDEAQDGAAHGTAPAAQPAEDPADGSGFKHSRAWDLHLWRGDDLPIVSLLAPRAIPGIDPHVGTSPPDDAVEPDPWFYYPQHAADLSVAQTESADPISPRTPVTYTIEVRNAGPNGATGVVLTDVLSKGTSILSATAAAGICSVAKAIVSCSLDDLPVGGSTTVTIRAMLAKAGSITSSVTVDAIELDLKELADPTSGWGDGGVDNVSHETTAVVR